MSDKTTRTELGFKRTVCACRSCTLPCKHMPGSLIPMDVQRIADHLGYGNDLGRFAREKLLASEGALVAQAGRVFRIPTLVPATRNLGQCLFLADGKCTTHSVAPFGCAFVDTHQTQSEADKVVVAGLNAVEADHRAEGDYSLLWFYLKKLSLEATSLAGRRRRLQKAWKKEGLI